MNKYNKRMKRKREIEEAALDFFMEKGYMRTTVAEIAEAVGLSKGGIYHHAKKKSELLRKIHDDMADEFFGRIKFSVVDTTDDSPRKLINWIKTHSQVMHDYQREIKVFFTEIKYLDEKPLEEVVKKRAQGPKILSDVIYTGIKKGEFRKDIDPMIIAFLILGMLNWMYQWYKPDGQASIEEIAENALKLIFYGLLPKESTEK